MSVSSSCRACDQARFSKHYRRQCLKHLTQRQTCALDCCQGPCHVLCASAPLIAVLIVSILRSMFHEIYGVAGEFPRLSKYASPAPDAAPVLSLSWQSTYAMSCCPGTHCWTAVHGRHPSLAKTCNQEKRSPKGGTWWNRGPRDRGPEARRPAAGGASRDPGLDPTSTPMASTAETSQH